MDEIKTKTGEDLKTMLEELYSWYFKKAQEVDQESLMDRDNYKIGVYDGCIQMLDTIYFALYGGQAAMANWLKNIGVKRETHTEIMREAFPDDPSTGS